MKGLHDFLEQKQVPDVYQVDSGGHEWPGSKDGFYLLRQVLLVDS